MNRILGMSGYLFIGIVVVTVLILILIFLVLRLSKKKKTVEKVTIDQTYLERLGQALGGKENIQSISIEHQRLRVFLIDAKKIVPSILKDIKAQAFLKGNEVKLLVKYQMSDVKKYLENKGI